MEYCDTLHPSGWQLHFSDALVKPGTDSFLLADFTRLRRNLRVCDLGAGIGLIGLLLLNRCPELTVHNVELQEAAVDMARRNIDSNSLQDRMLLHHADLRALRGVLPTWWFPIRHTSGRTAAAKPPERFAWPPAKNRPAPSRMSAPPPLTCCAGAGPSPWSTARSG